jgi:flagellar biosynthesis/type III secretory pathway protein FliH
MTVEMDKYQKMIDDLANSNKSLDEIELELHAKSLHEARQSGYTQGCNDGYRYGLESGNRCGEMVSVMEIGGLSFYCINSAIDALHKKDVSQALGVLRCLRDLLAHKIGMEEIEKA